MQAKAVAVLTSLSLTIVSTPVALVANPAAAQNVTADDACWLAVVREARGRMAADGVDQLSIDDRQGSNAETIVSGTGQANGQRFRYTCTFNVRTGQTYAVSVSPAGGSSARPSRPPASGGQSDPRAADACTDAVAAELRRMGRNGRVQRLDDSLRFRTTSATEKVVRGRGQVESDDGWDQFGFFCTFNSRNGTAYGVQVNF